MGRFALHRQGHSCPVFSRRHVTARRRTLRLLQLKSHHRFAGRLPEVIVQPPIDSWDGFLFAHSDRVCTLRVR